MRTAGTASRAWRPARCGRRCGSGTAAAQRIGQRLLEIGKGPEEARIKALAGSEAVFAQDITDAQLRWAYAHVTALLAVSHVDLGITPLEASAWGVPTVALRAGGYLGTIVEGVNRVFVEEPTVDAVADGVERLLVHDWDRAAMQAHAERFSEVEFGRRIRGLLGEVAHP
ncbi:glycosyltransferase [Micrococcus sp. R8502A1]|uniref:glycosyltransferase n=1 Tax=Micrococcus sp. R8502A1 TaxID=2583239 RepID=UPI0015EFCB55|nr:glycosyltransferase [Micrococcus sp. R8502A1]